MESTYKSSISKPATHYSSGPLLALAVWNYKSVCVLTSGVSWGDQ